MNHEKKARKSAINFFRDKKVLLGLKYFCRALCVQCKILVPVAEKGGNKLEI